MRGLKAEKSVQKAVERYLPKHLMAFVASKVREKGYEFREDIESALIVSAAADITLYDERMQEAIIATLDSIMPGMVRALPGEEPKALLATAVFVLQLVDRGLYKDPKATVVPTALLLVKEAEEDTELWMSGPQGVHRQANNLITYCNLKGLYLTTLIQ